MDSNDTKNNSVSEASSDEEPNEDIEEYDDDDLDANEFASTLEEFTNNEKKKAVDNQQVILKEIKNLHEWHNTY